MTQYNAAVWPPGIFPTPTNQSGNGGTAPQPRVQPAVIPPPLLTQATGPTTTGQGPVQTTYVDPATTQAGTNAFFGILSPTPGSGQ